MKKIVFAIVLLALGLPTQVLADINTRTSDIVTPIEGNFSRMDFEGFTMLIPSQSLVSETEKEAIVKMADGTYGMSVKIEEDRSASASAAVQICNRLVNDLDVKRAKVTRVIIHGMQGGRLEGTAEGAPVNVLVLDAGKKYLKLVIINTPAHADWANITIDSVNKIR